MKMKRSLICAVVLLSIRPLMAAPQAASADHDIHDELVRINASLREIALALKQQTEVQHADLLLKRVTLAATQLSAAEEKLKRIDQEIGTLREQNSEFETYLKSAQTTTPSSSAAEIKSRIASIQERVGVLTQDRVGAQNEIETLRRDAREWQTSLDKLLVSRP